MISEERLRSARILIVDDEEPNVRLLEKILAAEGYSQTLSITDSREAVALHGAFRPDVLLLDLHMPPPDGFSILDELKRNRNGGYVGILVLTADITRQTRIRALASGAHDFLTKPFDQLEVLSRLRILLETRFLYRDLEDQNRLLEEKVRERTEELRQNRLEIIQRLSRAVEFRDEGTGLHILRISQFSGALARALGLSRDHAELILSASPMHDIGKIAIPDRILLKEGPLTESEWEVMRRHTRIGYDLLSGHDSAIMRAAAEIALTHHERWDGAGYPQGLRGEAIPVEGRIVALCDVFDALLSRRPYKEPWRMEAAVEEIRRLSGEAFDPEMVRAFEKSLPEMRSIIAKISERLAESL
ncbi:MAG: HD domain-containing phosphohydrolase [Acidobacteriota bacterium]